MSKEKEDFDDFIGENQKFLSSIEEHKDKLDKYFKDPTDENAKELFGAENITGGSYRCKACGKLVPITQMQIFDTPVVKGCRAEICDECWKELNKANPAILVCMKCKEFRHVVEPVRNPKTGFELKPGQYYHIMDCPICDPEKYENKTIPAVIIEEALYNNRKPTDQI